MAVVAFGIVGFWRGLEKLLGPDQLYELMPSGPP
jgi:hypothetical protein